MDILMPQLYVKLQKKKKRMYDYLRLENTKAFIRALESKTRIPASTLIQTVKGGI